MPNAAKHLAAEWMLLAQMMIIAARRFSLLSKSGARGVEARAEAFELQLRCLLVALARQIDLCEDEEARRTLCVVYAALIALTMVAAKMRADLAELSRSEGWIKRSAINLAACLVVSGVYRKTHPALPISTRGYFDSS